MWDADELDSALGKALAACVMGALAVATIGFGGVRGTEFAPAAALVGLASLLWLVRLWTRRSHRFLLHPMLLPAAGFLGYAAWWLGRVAVGYPAGLEMLYLAVTALVLVVVLHNLHGQEETQWVVVFLVGLATVLSLYALIQFIRDSDRVLWLARPSQYQRRAGATFINPNHLAGFLVPILPLALSHVFLARGKAVLRVFHGYAALMMLVAIALTMSRGGWLAAGLVLVLFFLWLAIRRRHLRLVAIGCLGILLTAGSTFLLTSDKARARLENVATPGHQDSGLRSYLWRPTVALWKDNAWLGVGPGQFDVRFPKYRTPAVPREPGYAHNEYLNLLADYGVVGALLAGATVLALGIGIVRSQKFVERGPSDFGSKGSNRTAFFVGGSLGLTGLAVHSAGDFVLHIPAIGLTGATLAGLMGSTIRFASERWWLTPRWWSRVPVTLAVLGAVGWVGIRSWNYAHETWYLNRAARATVIDDRLLSNLEHAHRIAPGNPRTPHELGENYRRLSWQGMPGWREEVQKAVEWLERSAALNPHDPYTRMRLGLATHWLGDTERARREFERAVDLGPQDTEVLNHYGWNLLLQGRVRKAQAVFQQSMELFPWGNWQATKYLDEITAGRWLDREAADGEGEAGPGGGADGTADQR